MCGALCRCYYYHHILQITFIFHYLVLILVSIWKWGWFYISRSGLFGKITPFTQWLVNTRPSDAIFFACKMMLLLFSAYFIEHRSFLYVFQLILTESSLCPQTSVPGMGNAVINKTGMVSAFWSCYIPGFGTDRFKMRLSYGMYLLLNMGGIECGIILQFNKLPADCFYCLIVSFWEWGEYHCAYLRLCLISWPSEMSA